MITPATFSFSIGWRCSVRLGMVVVCMAGMAVAGQAYAETVEVAVSRSRLLTFTKDMAEVIVANPEIADVHNHGTRKLSVIGKSKGLTNVRVFDKNGDIIGQYDVAVGVDLAAIRKALKQFLPQEYIGVEMVNTNVALTGSVSSAEAVATALKITSEFLKNEGSTAEAQPEMSGGEAEDGAAVSMDKGILNLMQVTSGQQVMLRVRVGEVNRTALKQLGVEWANFGSPGNFLYQIAKDTGVEAFMMESAGTFLINSSSTNNYLRLGWNSGESGINALLTALEQDSLFKLLAEPNLVAISGQEAEFLAGGEIPILIPSGDDQVTIEYKPYGVAIKFKPFVLSDNRLRMEVAPEVSELDEINGVTISGFDIPAITTRRAKTTIELAPGESFMIAGLIKDEARTTIDNMPGVKEVPVLGALFRSTEFQRNETELVIAVTPYLVDPMSARDVKLPTDNFAHASDMEMIFYGALSAMDQKPFSGANPLLLEGPVGFMVE